MYKVEPAGWVWWLPDVVFANHNPEWKLEIIFRKQRIQGKKYREEILYPFADKFSKGERKKFPRYRKIFWIGALVLVTFMGFQIDHMEEPSN